MTNQSQNDRPAYAKGSPVTFLVDGQMIQGTFSHWAKDGEAYLKTPNKAYWRKPHKFQVIGEPITTIEVQNVGEEKPHVEATKFDINQKFKFLASYVKMVINKQQNSLIVTGDGGLGKTYTIMGQIKANPNMKEGINYIVIKGYSTAKGLYNTLYANSDKLIIFDDCDEVLTNDIAKNILKSALDSYEKRMVHWIAQTWGDDDEKNPPFFEFTGQIIFISNMPKHKIPQPVLSRANNIDLTMSTEDKIKRMENILPQLKQDVSMEFKQESLEVLRKFATRCRDFNFRTLIKVIEIRVSGEEEWESLAEFMCLS